MDKRLEKYLKTGGTLGSLAKMPKGRKASAPFPCDPAKVYARQVDALALRLGRIGAKDVVIGVSGGLDSALCLVVAYGAFAKLKLPVSGIHAYTMPGFGTSSRTKSNAALLCEGLGIEMETIPIAKSVRQHLKDIGHDGKTPDVTYENAQARMRTMILMDKANMLGAIVLGTGDLSEIALGWCTYNGDHMSMYGVNGSITKTLVRFIVRGYANKLGGRAGEILDQILHNPIFYLGLSGKVIVSLAKITNFLNLFKSVIPTVSPFLMKRSLKILSIFLLMFLKIALLLSFP